MLGFVDCSRLIYRLNGQYLEDRWDRYARGRDLRMNNADSIPIIISYARFNLNLPGHLCDELVA